MVEETISSFFEHFLTVMTLSMIFVQIRHEKCWWVAGNYQVYVQKRSAYLVGGVGQHPYLDVHIWVFHPKSDSKI